MPSKSKLRKAMVKKSRGGATAFSELQKARKEITRLRTQASTLNSQASRCQREVGQKLHDGICQELSAVALYVQSLRNQLDKGNSSRVPDLMDHLSQAVNKVVESTHALSRLLIGDGPEEIQVPPDDRSRGETERVS
jgi:signal transduction histidine kinase